MTTDRAADQVTDEFAVIDFALTAAAPERVVQALGQVQAMRARHQGGQGSSEPRRKSLLARFSFRGSGAHTPAPLLIQSAGTLAPAPLARFLPDELGFGAGNTPFRVTAPIGEAALTLVEFREADGDRSPIAEALSAELPGTEVFRFRLSGARHPGADTVFHVYVDGRAVRRAASISAEGTAPEAPWRVVDEGIPHAVEADSLPHDRARAWEIMTPARQGAILNAMGIEPDRLFDPLPGRVAVELSTAPEGRGLSVAGKLFREAGRVADRPTEGAAPDRNSEHAALSGEAPSDALEPAPEPPRAAAAEPAGSVSETDWEAEVTQILVTAVAHALPAEDQVPWLTRLTAKLEAGEVEAALAEARTLIAQGDRPLAERKADADRLDALFDVARH